MTCAPSEDSDQPGHLPSLIRVLPVRMKGHCVLSYPMSAQRRLWSDWTDAQADLGLRWAHRSFCWFCHETCPGWSESYLSAWRVTGSLAIKWVHSEDSDQTGRMPRLFWVFAGRTGHFVGFVMRWLIFTLAINFSYENFFRPTLAS